MISSRINLTAASIVHLVEPHWNPMVEAQAIDRVYRIGQTQEVTVIRYIVPTSVETVSGPFFANVQFLRY
jgi:SNF2 family DNA or RNA helicase